MKQIVLLIFITVFSYSSEPSAFDAGDLNIAHPYGLTSNEKVILKNKKEVKTLSTNVGFVKSELSSMQEKIDGIRSVVESQNSIISKINKKIYLLQQNDTNISSRLQNITNDLNSTKELQNQNYQKIKLVLSELSSLIDSINNSYVSKDNFNNKLTLLENKFNQKIAELQKQSFRKNLSLETGSKVFSKAKKLYKQKMYSKAKLFFQESIKKKHLPATSSFYLGEIDYANKDFPGAINYYKKSISLYSKTAWFTPTLLFHTYLSFKKLGDKKNAYRFKKILINKYPKSKEAKKAKKL